MTADFIHIDQTFERVAFVNDSLSGREFDGCTFFGCNFSGSAFVGCTFIDCEFADCNLAMLGLAKTGLKNVSFKRCKILGVRFDGCDDFLFQVGFYGCTLDYAWFSGKKMPGTSFSDCTLKGVNFSNADLGKADFSGSDLTDAVFDETKLDGADFSTALHYSIDPQFNSLRKAKFSLDGLHGLLEKHQIDIR